MDVVHSADGTHIAFDRLGQGDPLVLVSGASTGRALHGALAELLAEHFTVLNYDRRGRGDSGDSGDYAVEREIEDLAAVLDVTGPARVFGNSSGAVLALRAAIARLPITELALWEPPIMLDPDAPRRHRHYLTELTGRLDRDRPGEAMALFLSSVGLPQQAIDGMRQSPGWADLEAIAPTLVYDAQVMGDSTLPTGLESVTVPTVVLTGSETGAWAETAARALTDELPTSRHHVLDGQNHAVAWDVLAAALVGVRVARTDPRN
jgi:alpha-beta hydrolase superfamily lysophospholipase